MSCRVIRVSSRALGPRLFVTVKVYDTLAELRQAGEAYNGTPIPEAIGVTQATCSRDGRTTNLTVRLARDHLGTQVVVHEMHHASTAWYGALVGDRVSRRAHLHHFNEPFAHLHSDLTQRLVDRLYAYGYYGG